MRAQIVKTTCDEMETLNQRSCHLLYNSEEYVGSFKFLKESIPRRALRY